MKVLVRCPVCGTSFYIDVNNEKGKGAYYTRNLEKLSPLQVKILKILADLDGKYPDGVPKRIIARILYTQDVMVSGNSISGRLSELLGAGLVSVKRTRVKVFDRKSMQFRFRKLPVWKITAEGLRRIQVAADA